MFKSLVQESIHEMHHDVNIIRLTFLTSFFHSLIAILLIILNLNDLLARHYENGLYIGKVAKFFVQEINKNHIVAVFITITVSLFIAYSIVYPIGQSAIIHYFKNKNGIQNALKKGLDDFFPMFEFGILSAITSSTIWILAAFRIFILAHNYTVSTIVLMSMRFLTISVANVLKAYTRYCITIEGLPLYEALKRSFFLTSSNFKSSFKYMRIQTILLFNFSINLLLIMGIPFLLIYLSLSCNIIKFTAVKIIIYLIFVFLVLLGAYMSNFIRAFFAYYRYKLYQLTKK